MTILVPADADEMRRHMPLTAKHKGPIYIRLAKGNDPIVTPKDKTFEIGKAVPVREGSDILIITTGICLGIALEVSDRMNEEGKIGQVYIFQLEGSSFPDQLYQTLSKYTLSLLQEDISRLYTYDFFTAYYAKVVKLFVDTDKKQINTARMEYKFETVANTYHLIDTKTTSLFVANYSKETLDFLSEIKYKPFLSKDDYRYMQKFGVQVYDGFLRKTEGQWEKKDQGYYVWYGSYSPTTGISPDPILADYIQ